MSVDPNDVAIKKCFVTANGQVRRVLAINDGVVLYEYRGKKAIKGDWPDRKSVATATFAGDVANEVKCDYDPDFA